MITNWYDLNAKRGYPLVETATTLPSEVLVDAGFIVLPETGFRNGQHRIRLMSIQDIGGTTVRFRFSCDAPLFAGINLRPYFDVSRTAAKGTYAFAVAQASDEGGWPAAVCDIDAFMGFIVLGDMTYLDGFLATNQTIALTDHFVEPVVVQSMADSLITGLVIANKDRTLAQAPLDCPVLEWGDRPDYWILSSCERGPVILQAGYNARVQQIDRTNTILLGVLTREGTATPCIELPLSEDEEIPSWSLYRDGSVACHQTIRSIGGASGPNLVLSSRQGVAISTVAAENRVIVDFNFSGLIVCPTEVEYI